MDTLAFVQDDFLSKHKLDKGIMTLADGDRQGDILLDLKDHQLELRSGGSAANTMWTIARSGGRAVYTGKVSDDPNGEFYRHDLERNGVTLYGRPMHEDHGPTGTCVVMTTADAQRTMCTHLGVSVLLHADDINTDALKDSKIAYLEGYLWMGDDTRATSEYALQLARQHDVLAAYTFSDPFCVKLHREDFERISREYLDIIFCNADELRMFAGTEDLEAGARQLGSMVDLAFITNSEHGCLVMDHGELHHVDGFPVKAIDTNGAGDAFAGGVLFGLTNGYDPRKAARWGNYLGSQVVQIHGARLQNDYQSHIPGILHD